MYSHYFKQILEEIQNPGLAKQPHRMYIRHQSKQIWPLLDLFIKSYYKTMGCNQSKSETQPLPVTASRHDNHNKINNTAMAHHEVPKQNTISHDSILFQENQNDNNIEINKRPTKQGQNNKISQAQQQKGLAQKQRQETPSIEQIRDIEITSMLKLMQAIEFQLQDNRLYTNIFDTSHLKEILSFIRKNNLSREYLYSSLSLLLKFMKICNEVGKKQPILKIDSFETVFTFLGKEWSKFKNFIYDQKRIYQKIRSLIIPSKTNEVAPHFNSYLNLRFDKDFKQSEKLLEALKQIIKYEPSYFCFYTNYLIKCCKNLQLQGKKSMEIEILLEEHCQFILTQIQNECRALPQVDSSKDQTCKYHQNFKAKLQPEQKRFYEFDNKSKVSKEQQLQQYVKALLDQTGSTYNQLLDFSTDVCSNQQYQIRPQVMDNDEQSVFELKLSTFKDVQFQKYSPLQVQGESYSQFVSNQLQNLKKQRQSIYEFMTGKIEFKASCIFKIRHVFERISLLNKCVDGIKQQILNKKYLLVQIKNNLNIPKGQKFMLFIFAINLYKIQVKLILDFNLSTFILKDYFQSIIHSKMCTALTSLHLLNDTLTHQFMSRIYPLFQQIEIKSKQGRKGSQIPQQFEQLLMLWNVKFPKDSQVNKNQQLNLKFLQRLKNIFLDLKANRFTLKNQQKIYRLYNKIIFKSLQNQHNNSNLQFELFKAYINKEKSELKNNQNKETINAIIRAYSKCLMSQAQKQFNRKNFTISEEIAKQSEQLQLNLSQQPRLQSIRIRKILQPL